MSGTAVFFEPQMTQIAQMKWPGSGRKKRQAKGRTRVRVVDYDYDARTIARRDLGMGRTWLTFNDQLAREEQAWRPFRTALRKDDQAAFDRIFVLAKRHMAEAQAACRPVALDAVLMCVALELLKEVEALRGRIKQGR